MRKPGFMVAQNALAGVEDGQRGTKEVWQAYF